MLNPTHNKVEAFTGTTIPEDFLIQYTALRYKSFDKDDKNVPLRDIAKPQKSGAVKPLSHCKDKYLH